MIWLCAKQPQIVKVQNAIWSHVYSTFKRTSIVIFSQCRAPESDESEEKFDSDYVFPKGPQGQRAKVVPLFGSWETNDCIGSPLLQMPAACLAAITEFKPTLPSWGLYQNGCHSQVWVPLFDNAQVMLRNEYWAWLALNRAINLSRISWKRQEGHATCLLQCFCPFIGGNDVWCILMAEDRYLVL